METTVPIITHEENENFFIIKIQSDGPIDHLIKILKASVKRYDIVEIFNFNNETHFKFNKNSFSQKLINRLKLIINFLKKPFLKK